MEDKWGGGKDFLRLVKIFGSARVAWEASRVELAEVLRNDKLVDSILKQRSEIDPLSEYDWLKRRQIQLLRWEFDKDK